MEPFSLSVTRTARFIGRWRRVLSSMGLSVGLCAGAVASGADTREEVHQVGDYTLRTIVLRAGTRSEGRIGRLWHHGIEVPGQVPGESFLVTSAAATTRFTYMGDARPYNWSISGWTNLATQR